MTQEKIALLPCPFCGAQPRVSKRQDEDLWTHNVVWWHCVRCAECDVIFDRPETAEESAEDRWNKRAPALALHQRPESEQSVTADNGLVARLRQRANFARAEKTGTADGDAYHFDEAANEIERLQSHSALDRPDAPFRVALCGSDPEMPQTIQPIGWLHTMIEECKRHASQADRCGIEDIDAYYMMINEVAGLYVAALAALAGPQIADNREVKS